MGVFRSGLVAALTASLSVSPAFAQARHVVDPPVVAGRGASTITLSTTTIIIGLLILILIIVAVD